MPQARMCMHTDFNTCPLLDGGDYTSSSLNSNNKGLSSNIILGMTQKYVYIIMIIIMD